MRAFERRSGKAMRENDGLYRETDDGLYSKHREETQTKGVQPK